MRLRVTILLVLTLLTLTYRGTAFYMRYFSPDLQTRSYFAGNYQGGDHVVVVHVDEEQTCLQGIPPEERVQVGDRILEIYDHNGNGGEIHGLIDYGSLLRPIGTEPWRMVVERPFGKHEGKPDRFERIEIAMPGATPVNWPLGLWAASLGMDLFLPALALAVGCLVGFLRPRDRRAFLAGLMFIAFSLGFRQQVTQFPVVIREMAYVLSTVAMYLTPYLFMHFFLQFPKRSSIDQRAPWLRPLALAGTLVFCGLHVIGEGSLLLSFELHGQVRALLYPLGLTSKTLGWGWFVLAGVMFAISFVALLRTAFRAETPTDRRRSRIITIGAAVGLLPIIVLSAMEPLGVKVPHVATAAGILLASVFPASFAYSVIMHQVFGIRLILRRGLQYALVSKSFLVFEGIVLFAAMYYITRPLMIQLLPEDRTSLAAVGVGLVTIGLVVGTQRLNRTIFPAIDRRFFRDAYDARTLLTQLSHAVRRLASRPDLLLARVADEILAALHPSRVAVFLREDLCPRVGSLPDTNQAPLRWIGQVEPNGVPRTMVCCLTRTSAGELPEQRAPFSRLGAPMLAPRRALARHLQQAASSQGPDPLDVIVVDRRAGLPAGESMAMPGNETLNEQQLLERLNARLVVPLVTKGCALGFIVLGEKLSEEPYSAEDRELLGTVAEQAAIALDYSTLIEHVAERERLEREIQIASEVQARLLPSEGPRIEGLRYFASCRPARGVGGDFYDFLGLGPGRLGIGVGDVAGKGISAALLMASLQALLRSHAVADADRPVDLVRELNRHLCETTDDARFATFFFAAYDQASRRLKYINAGHVPPLVVRAPDRENGETQVERLASSGTPLGLFEDGDWRSEEIELRPGDRLLMFSDGLTEASGPEDGEMFGEQRLLDIVRRLGKAIDEQELLRRILDEVDRFGGRGAPQDDITLVVARIV
jgi:sigma-B regulation protein RsbU (phosphoserine phosphatase)